MGNVIGSFFSGLFDSIGKLFGSPLDFLSGKSCRSLCPSTWDFICYIENFCVANLLKMAMVLILCYIVLLFFYLLYKVGICQCIGHTCCKMVWGCITSWFAIWEYCCSFLCMKLLKLKRRRHRKHFRELEKDLYTTSSCSSSNSFDEEYNDPDLPCRFSLDVSRSPSPSPSRRWRDHRRGYIRKSLRPRSHRTRVAISRNPGYSYKQSRRRHRNHVTTVHDIRVSRTSKFVQKGANDRRAVYRNRK